MPKVQNYTDVQVSEMQAEYEKATNADERMTVVNEIAKRFKKTPRSIISKMSREGFYIKKVVVSKVTGEKPANKETLAEDLRFVSGLPMVSAEKLNKTDIQDLISHFKALNEAEVEPDLSEQD